MPFTVNVGPYRGGEFWYEALSQVGRNLSTSIGQAMQFYEQRHNALTNSDAFMQMLSEKAGPDGKPILDPKSYERYLAHSDSQRAAYGEAYKSMMLFGNELAKTGAEVGRLKAETDLVRAREDALQTGAIPPDEGSDERISPLTGRAERWSPKSKTWIPIPESTAEKEEAKNLAVLQNPSSVTRGTMRGGEFIATHNSRNPNRKQDFIQVTDSFGQKHTFPVQRWREIKKKIGGGKTDDLEAPPMPTGGANETRRKTADGRTAVFDSKTKKFIRYEDDTAAAQ